METPQDLISALEDLNKEYLTQFNEITTVVHDPAKGVIKKRKGIMEVHKTLGDLKDKVAKIKKEGLPIWKDATPEEQDQIQKAADAVDASVHNFGSMVTKMIFGG